MSAAMLARALGAVLAHDLRLSLRRGAQAALPPLFMILAAALFPLAVGPDPALLARIAAGVAWVLGLLAMLLSLDGLFAEDHRNGMLDCLALSPAPLTLVMLARTLAHWLVTGLPVVALAPVVAVMLNLPVKALPALAGGLLLGTPSLSLIGVACAALATGARRSALLVPLLALPLCAPALIFGATAVAAAADGGPVRAQMLLLGAMLAGLLPLAPVAMAAGVRLACE